MLDWLLKLVKLDFLSPMMLLVLDLLSPKLLIPDLLPPLDLISSKFLPTIELLLLLKLFLPWPKLLLEL